MKRGLRATAWVGGLLALGVIALCVLFRLPRHESAHIETRSDSTETTDEAVFATQLEPDESTPFEVDADATDSGRQSVRARTSRPRASERRDRVDVEPPSATLRVQRADGSPLRGQLVGLQHAAGSQQYKYGFARDSLRHSGATDENGVIVLEHVATGDFFVGVLPPASARRDDELIGLGVRAKVSESSRDRIGVTLPAPLYVAGIVKDIDGAPVGSGTVIVSSKHAAGGASTEISPAGEFRVGPIVAGECTLMAFEKRSGLASGPVPAFAGDGAVEIVMRRSEFRVRIASPDRSKVRLDRFELDVVGRMQDSPPARRQDDGTYVVETQGARVNGVVITCLDRRIGVAPVVLEHRDALEVTDVVLAPAGELSLKNRGARACSISLRATNDVRVALFELAPDASKLVTVPAGIVTLELTIDGVVQRSSIRVGSTGITFGSVP